MTSGSLINVRLLPLMHLLALELLQNASVSAPGDCSVEDDIFSKMGVTFHIVPTDYQQNNFFQDHLETLIKMAHPMATMILKYTTTTAIPVTMDQLPNTSPDSLTL